MRIFYILIFVIVAAFELSAQDGVGEQRLDYICIKKPLVKVLKELSRKTGTSIIFSEQKIPGRRKISLQANNEKLEDILGVVLSKTNLRYDIVGDQILIIRVNRNMSKHNTISGYIRDEKTGDPLINAIVYQSETFESSRTNASGFYTLTLPLGYHDIIFSYLGYSKDTILVNVDEDKVINNDLSNISRLNEIVILDRPDAKEYTSAADYHHVSIDQMTSTASLGGETDVLRHINLLPGVNSGADGFGGLNVRGGSDDQNLILYDGVPVYNVDHAFGLLSVFNSDMINNAEVHKGNFSSKYGGRLSSIVDIKTRNGNSKKITGTASISTIAAKTTIEGPIGSNGSTFIVSGRRTYLDPWLKLGADFLNQELDREGAVAYNFYDLNGKVNLKIGNKSQLAFSYYKGKDDYLNNYLEAPSLLTGIQDQSLVDWEWSNEVASVNLKSQLGQKAFSNLILYYTAYNISSLDQKKTFASTDRFALNFNASVFQSDIVDRGLKWDVSYQPNGKHVFRVGAEAILHKFTPAINSITDGEQALPANEILTVDQIFDGLVLPELFSTEVSAYVDDVYTPQEGFELQYGLRANVNFTDNKSYVTYQPRIALRASSGDVFFKLGLSRMVQHLHRIQNAGLGFPAAIWLPSTDIVGPAKSWVTSSSLGFSIEKSMKVVTSLYYKRLEDVSTFKEGPVIPISDDKRWENLIPKGNGDAYGLELSFDKYIGKTTWRLNYSLAFSNRNFPDINNGKTYAFRYDRRHQLKAVVTHRLNKNVEFMVNYIYGTGSPVTEPSQFFQDEDTEEVILIYDGKNNTRLPDYTRMDLAFNFYNNLKIGKQRVSIGLYNVFNDKNFLYSDIVRDQEKENGFDLFRYRIVPIFPSLSYSLVW